MTDAEVRRIKCFPMRLENARRKVQALEREAARLGFHDLLKPEKQA